MSDQIDKKDSTEKRERQTWYTRKAPDARERKTGYKRKKDRLDRHERGTNRMNRWNR